MPVMRSYSRRGFLGLAAAGASAAMLSAMGRVPARLETDAPPAAGESVPSRAEVELGALIASSVESTVIERPVHSELVMMETTRYATRVRVMESGRPGPVVMVLGGVHGNEPGGWRAAEEMVHWDVAHGTLIVAPRINHLSAEQFRRTTPALGDLNRLYPGDPSGLPMERMAHEIVELARRYSVTHLFDLHESWSFYRDRAPGNRSVSSELGQLVIVGGEPDATDLLAAAAADVNASIEQREEFIVYDRRHPDWSWIGLGRSSISLAAHIEGCTPILVETAQDGQPEERRAELHCALVQATFGQLGMTEHGNG
jgi:hypothetical protein